MSGWGVWLASGAAAYLILVIVLRLSSRFLLFRPWRFLIEPRLCSVEGVELKNIHPEDNERLYVWHHRPQKPGAPVLVYFDGNRGNIAIWTRRWRRIADAGAGFIARSYRGYGGSTQRPSEEGLHEDAVMTWLWAQQHYPEDQLIAHGYSLGSGVAARIGVKNKPLAVVLEAPYTSIVNRAQEMFPFLPAGLILRDKFETWKDIEHIKSPVLIVHGKKDRVVPHRHGHALFDRATEPKRYVSVPKANHVNLTSHGLYEAIWQFVCFTPLLPASPQADKERKALSHAKEMQQIRHLASRLPPHSEDDDTNP